MTEAMQRRARLRLRIIRIQWCIILILVVALIIAVTARPDAPVEETIEATNVTMSPAPPEPEPTPPEPEPTPQPEPELIELGEFRTTAYCTCVSCCGIWSDEHPSRIDTDYVQKTASGTIPTEGRTVAADTDVLPFGTVVVIDGQEYIVEDRGGAVKGNSIDIYFDSHEEAVEYGLQYKIIYKKGD